MSPRSCLDRLVSCRSSISGGRAARGSAYKCVAWWIFPETELHSRVLLGVSFLFSRSSFPYLSLQNNRMSQIPMSRDQQGVRCSICGQGGFLSPEAAVAHFISKRHVAYCASCKMRFLDARQFIRHCDSHQRLDQSLVETQNQPATRSSAQFDTTPPPAPLNVATQQIHQRTGLARLGGPKLTHAQAHNGTYLSYSCFPSRSSAH